MSSYVFYALHTDEIQTIISYIEDTLAHEDVESLFIELAEGAEAEEKETIMEIEDLRSGEVQECSRARAEQGLEQGLEQG